MQVRVPDVEEAPPLSGPEEPEQRPQPVRAPRGLDPGRPHALDAAVAIEHRARVEVEPDALPARARERVIVDREDDARSGVRGDPEDAGAQAREVVHVDDVGAEVGEGARERASPPGRSRVRSRKLVPRVREPEPNRPGLRRTVEPAMRVNTATRASELGLGESRTCSSVPPIDVGRQPVDDVEDPQLRLPCRMRRSNHSNRPSRFHRTDFAPRYCARFCVNA